VAAMPAAGRALMLDPVKKQFLSSVRIRSFNAA
jgi:hypothetical protein